MRPSHLLQLLCVVLVVVVASQLVGSYQVKREVRRGEEIVAVGALVEAENEQSFARLDPELVLVGNSILDAAVGQEHLRVVTGLRTYKFVLRGSASALWYTMLRYAVIGKGHRPKYVVVFFKDLALTHPRLRTDPRYQVLMRYFGAEDPLLEELVFHPPVDPLTSLMREHWSLYRARATMLEDVELLAREDLIGAVFGVDRKTIHSAVSSTFAKENLVPELATLEEVIGDHAVEEEELFDFDLQLDRSFLPAMIEMSQAAGIQLVFVRIPARRDQPESIAARDLPQYARKRLPAYVGKLSAYLEAQRVPLIDLTGEPSLRLEHYDVGDHLNSQTGRPLFTVLLAQRLKARGIAGGSGGSSRRR